MKKFYSIQDLWSLFLMSAFPLHLWALLMAFRDISWVAERTNFWDAVGVLSYGLIFAFFESLLFFLFAFLLGFLVPAGWGREKRLAILSLSVLALAFWAMISQLYFLQAWDVSAPLAALLSGSAHPLRFLYAAAFVIVLPFAVLPVWWAYKSAKALAVILDLVSRFSLLTALYLFLDAAALVIIIIRNI